jgi:hypothetical protein
LLPQRVGFRHPHTGQWRNFEAPLPADFKEAIAGTALQMADYDTTDN